MYGTGVNYNLLAQSGYLKPKYNQRLRDQALHAGISVIEGKEYDIFFKMHKVLYPHCNKKISVNCEIYKNNEEKQKLLHKYMDHCFKKDIKELLRGELNDKKVVESLNRYLKKDCGIAWYFGSLNEAAYALQQFMKSKMNDNNNITSSMKSVILNNLEEYSKNILEEAICSGEYETLKNMKEVKLNEESKCNKHKMTGEQSPMQKEVVKQGKKRNDTKKVTSEYIPEQEDIWSRIKVIKNEENQTQQRIQGSGVQYSQQHMTQKDHYRNINNNRQQQQFQQQPQNQNKVNSGLGLSITKKSWFNTALQELRGEWKVSAYYEGSYKYPNHAKQRSLRRQVSSLISDDEASQKLLQKYHKLNNTSEELYVRQFYSEVTGQKSEVIMILILKYSELLPKINKLNKRYNDVLWRYQRLIKLLMEPTGLYKYTFKDLIEKFDTQYINIRQKEHTAELLHSQKCNKQSNVLSTAKW